MIHLHTLRYLFYIAIENRFPHFLQKATTANQKLQIYVANLITSSRKHFCSYKTNLLGFGFIRQQRQIFAKNFLLFQDPIVLVFFYFTDIQLVRLQKLVVRNAECLTNGLGNGLCLENPKASI